jgi:hypothetical protein
LIAQSQPGLQPPANYTIRPVICQQKAVGAPIEAGKEDVDRLETHAAELHVNRRPAITLLRANSSRSRAVGRSHFFPAHAFGMVLQFGMHLTSFVRRRVTS